MLNVGFVGAGYMAGRHAGAVAAAGARVAAVYDVIADRRTGLAERYQAAACESLDELLATPDLDAVFVCVPPDGHGTVERALIEQRTPFFVEKPLPPNLDEARNISEAIAAADLTTSVGYHWRYLDRLDDVQSLLAKQPAHLVIGQWHDGFPGVPWWGSRARSGGQIVEQATHLVDLSRFFLGEAVRVQACSSLAVPLAGRSTGADVASSTAAIIQFAAGGVAVIASSCTLPRRHTVAVELICEGRAITLTEEQMTVVEGGVTTRLACDGDPILVQARAFLRAIEQGTSEGLVPYAEALLTHEIAVAVATAAVEAQLT